WLEEKIWPLEAKLRPEDVYWGTRLACIEMIKSGITCFNDMYFFPEETARAADDSGMRAIVGPVFIDLMDRSRAEEEIKREEKFFKASKKLSNRITPALNPHSVYSVSRESLEWCRDFARENDLPVHIHLSETKAENEECIKRTGKTPTAYLDEIGLLGPKTVAAHCVWLSDNDMKIIAKRGVKVSHNPISNMKLSTGRAMPFEQMLSLGIIVALGTDGCAANNCLDMFQTMKCAALLQKFIGMPTHASAQKVFNAATLGGAMAFNLKAGQIREGFLADVVLIDLNDVRMVPNHNLISNIVYAASPTCIDTVICDGKILMESGIIPDEDKVIEKARKVAENLIERAT
ncbi:MAG: amidohydrolase, partial [Candidatus Aenigmatarchaeota archaeon]